MKTSKIVLFAALFLILFGVIFILIVNDSYKYKITYEDKQYTYEIKVFEKIYSGANSIFSRWNMIRKKELRKYYNLIRKNLFCSYNMKKVLISDFSNRVNDFIFENPNVDIQKIMDNFGSPEDIAKSFDTENIYLKKKAKKLLIIEIILIVLILLLVLFSIYIIREIIINLGGTIVITTY